MAFLVDAMHRGGPFMWLLMLLVMVAWVPLVVGAVLLGSRRWVPAAVFWVVPGLLVLAGTAGRLQGIIVTEDAIHYASLETRGLLMHAGLGVAAFTEWSGWGLAALVLALGAPLVGLGLIVGAGEQARWRPVQAILALVAGLGGAVAAGAVASLDPGGFGPGAEAWAPSAALLAGGLSMALAAARDNDEEAHAARLAGGRALVASLVIGSLLCAGLAGTLHGYSMMHEAIARASAEVRVTLVAAGAQAMLAWAQPTAVGLLAAMVGGIVVSASGVRHLLGGRALVSGAVVALGLLTVAAAAGFVNLSDHRLSSRSPEHHLAGLMEGMEPLPRTILSGEDEPLSRPLDAFELSLTWRGGGWHPGRVGADEPGWALPLEGGVEAPVLLLAPARLPASTLTGTAWTQGATTARLLIAADTAGGEPGVRLDPAGAAATLGSVELLWIPAAAWPTEPSGHDPEDLAALLRRTADQPPRLEDVVFIEGGSGGATLHRVVGSLEGVRDIPRGMTAIFAGEERPDDLTAVLVPASGWTVQDLVSRCLDAGVVTVDVSDAWRLPATRCALTPAVPPVLEAQREARRRWEERGLFGLGGLGSPMGDEPVRGLNAEVGVGGSGAGVGRLAVRGVHDGAEDSPGDAAANGVGSVNGGDSIILGSLDKGVIQGVIREHLARIRFCYQRALTDHPDLAGQVNVKFVVAKDGSVSSASIKSSTLGDSQVEGCITAAFMDMRFPEPRGGGIVIVSYPFVFQPGT